MDLCKFGTSQVYIVIGCSGPHVDSVSNRQQQSKTPKKNVWNFKITTEHQEQKTIVFLSVCFTAALG